MRSTTKDKKPIISVIIPVYNTEKYLGTCLDSVAQQTFRDIEIILINDGSTDNSLQIAYRYAEQDDRIKVITQDNAGVSAARNRGLREAHGEYIGFVDSDDWISPQMYQVLFSLMEEYDADISEVSICRTEKENNQKNEKAKQITVYTQEEYLKRFFKIESQETVYYPYNKLYKRSTLTDNQFPPYKVGEDVVSTFKAITKCNRVVSSDEELYYYRQGSGITSRFNEHYLQLVNVWDDVYDLSKDMCIQYQEWAEINRKRIRLTILSEMAISGAYKEDVFIRQKEELLSELKKFKPDLLQAPISKSRKILVILFCMNYDFTAEMMHLFVKRRQ